MANKRLIKSAVDSVLSTHGIVDSGYEGKLSDLAMDEVRTIMTDKFRGNTEYLGRAKLYCQHNAGCRRVSMHA